MSIFYAAVEDDPLDSGGLFNNSCSSNVADALESIGILAHDPRWLPTLVTPAELDAVLQKSRRLAKKNFYPKQVTQ